MGVQTATLNEFDGGPNSEGLPRAASGKNKLRVAGNGVSLPVVVVAGHLLNFLQPVRQVGHDLHDLQVHTPVIPACSQLAFAYVYQIFVRVGRRLHDDMRT
jgi:hypothetical protein